MIKANKCKGGGCATDEEFQDLFNNERPTLRLLTTDATYHTHQYGDETVEHHFKYIKLSNFYKNKYSFTIDKHTVESEESWLGMSILPAYEETFYKISEDY